MRRIVVLLVLALGAALLPAPALAADIVIVSRSGNTVGDPAILVLSTLCGDPTTPASGDSYSVDRVAGPDVASVGSGSASITRSQADQVSGFALLPRELSSLTTLGGSFRSSFAGQVQAVLAVFENGHTWRGVASVPLTVDTWTPVDLTGATFDWVDQTGGLNPFSATMAGFVTARGSFSTSGIVGAGQCAAPTLGTVYVDDVRVSSGSDTQLVDFEPLLPTKLTNAAKPSATLLAGQNTYLLTRLTSNGIPLADQPVSFYVKYYGDATFTDAFPINTDSTGWIQHGVGPRDITKFRWRYAGDADHAAAQSPVVTIQVHPRVRIGVRDRYLQVGQKVDVVGSENPVKLGFVLTLWRKTDSGKVKLASTTQVRKDGTFEIRKTMTRRGTYFIYVTIPAGGGNLSGQSVLNWFKVS